MVAEISTKAQLIEFTKDDKKLTVIDFTANHAHVNFVKVDLSEGTNELATEYSVTAMPTFVFLVGGDEVHRIRGANPAGLKSTVAQYAKPASSGVFSGQGHTFVTTTWSNMNPQVKVLIALGAAYVFFWLI
ncbi:hypothetical protein BDR07DRAFT_864513 [Suillus spraguei]|nr:hypothetical protein BDR07DRAFT_864513 [Suillus spraguei]